MVTLREGEFPGITFPITWSERLHVGYIRALHVDGRRSVKFPFHNFGAMFTAAHRQAEYHATVWTEARELP